VSMNETSLMVNNPAAFAFSGKGLYRQTGREGGRTAFRCGVNSGGRALHAYVQIRHVYIKSHNTQFRDSSSIALAVTYMNASGHLLFPFLFLGSGLHYSRFARAAFIYLVPTCRYRLYRILLCYPLIQGFWQWPALVDVVFRAGSKFEYHS